MKAILCGLVIHSFLLRCVKGQWSSWRKEHVGACMSDCKRTISLTRACNTPNPHPGIGRTCNGSHTDFILEECTGDDCLVNEQWSNWETFTVGPCLATCKQTIILHRTCLNPVLLDGANNSQCSGFSHKTMLKDCQEDSCIRRRRKSEQIKVVESDYQTVFILIVSIAGLLGVTMATAMFMCFRAARTRLRRTGSEDITPQHLVNNAYSTEQNIV